MEIKELSALNSINEALYELIHGDIPESVLIDDSSNEELKTLCELIDHLIMTYSDARTFLLALSEGLLEVEIPRKNFLVSPFKQLHANLRHLTWQTQQVAKGDLNQHVDFLGEFSESFNAMIESLKEKKAIEDALGRSEKKLRDITSALGEGVFMLDTEGKLTFMNPEAENLLGWAQEELLGQVVFDYIRTCKDPKDPVKMKDCPEFKTIQTAETYRVQDDVFLTHDGELLPVAYVVTPVLENGVAVGSVTAFHDTTELKRSQEALKRANELLERQAKTDSLTGIANRMRFNSEIAIEIIRSKRHNIPLSIIMFDIDHFKRVNDTYGHLVGDSLLKEITEVVGKSIRGEDLFARWGGEEFVVLLPHTALQGAKNLAERLRSSIEENDFTDIGTITCSFGATQFDGLESQEMFLNRVDQALYGAKESGRNCIIAI
jgi:diguanylate cyclase (GGDEF)-like protein/PAS domain S-box-containing protein